jgi:uncharacterized tellurite resistance protein B-like protein
MSAHTGSTLDRLADTERMTLMKFVCSFAWADLEIRPEERDFVARMVRRLELQPDEARQVERWLEVPPAPESIDPSAIPTEHRQLFLHTIEGIIAADGEIAAEERENLNLLRQLA